MKKNLEILLIITMFVVIIAALIIVFSRPKPVPSLPVEVKTEQEDIIKDFQSARAQSYAAIKELDADGNDKIIGSIEAPLKIFVYENYLDLYSANLAETLERIKEEEAEQVALVVRPYAVGESLAAKQAASAVDCASEAGKWAEMRDLLFIKTKNGGFDLSRLLDYAREIGLDEKDFSACLTKNEKSEKIEKLTAEAEDYLVQGTPTIFIGDEMILGARPYDDFIDSNGDKIEGLKAVVAKKLGEARK